MRQGPCNCCGRSLWVNWFYYGKDGKIELCADCCETNRAVIVSRPSRARQSGHPAPKQSSTDEDSNGWASNARRFLEDDE